MKKTKKDKIFYNKEIDSLWLFVKSRREEEHREVTPGISLE